MLDRLLPAHLDNTYRGRKLALWLFGIVSCVKLLQGLSSAVNARSIAQSADGIPLASFPPTAADTVVAIFALLGLYLVTLHALSLLVLFRYRSAVPFMIGLQIVFQLVAKLVLQVHPIVRVGTHHGTTINWVLLGLLLLAFVLSLVSRPKG